MTETEINGEPITAEGIKELRAEIEELEGPRRLAMAEQLKAAIEIGDLKENADYHIAKEDQAHLETRIKRLRMRLRDAVVIEVEPEPNAATFAFGHTAEVIDESNDRLYTWKLVGSTEADLSKGRLSAESPVGHALIGCPIGEAVDIETPKGIKTFRVKKLVG